MISWSGAPLLRRNQLMSDTTVNEFRPQRADAVTAPISEDWLAVVLGLAIFVLALAALVNVDLIGWVVTTSVWSNFSQALKATSKDFSSLGGYRRAGRDLCRASGRAQRRRRGAQGQRDAFRARLHRRVLDRLCELGDRQLRQLRRGYARPNNRNSASAGRSSSPMKAAISLR